jgi:hypothetical protein
MAVSSGVPQSHAMTALVKVRFDLDSGDWHGHGSEMLWAAPVVQTEWRSFQIMNSPLFTRGISYHDIVVATSEDHVIFRFDKVERRSGHSTYMILHEPKDNRVRAYWDLLERIGCSYESMRIRLSIGEQSLLSVDVPPSVDLDEVCEILERGHDQRVWMFQEGYKFVATQTP